MTINSYGGVPVTCPIPFLGDLGAERVGDGQDSDGAPGQASFEVTTATSGECARESHAGTADRSR
ncbi:hypothetical protein GCM10022225_31700 [Plantactinospora mayteni]|uniref:Uncharacterized protein n=1 Tax=Plantactinospora mayteni TaxID=566021 RepID=A0ABQ4ELR3_9ACTN|nr:hypothetical protein Pma05_22390 [Plantactinospora mayteni]